MPSKRLSRTRAKEIVLAVIFTIRKEGLRNFFNRSQRWLRGERRYTQSPRKRLDLPHPLIPSAASAARPIAELSGVPASLSYLAVLTGLPAQLEQDAYLLLQALNNWSQTNPDDEIVIVADGPLWKHIARSCRAPIRVVYQPSPCQIPGQLFQLGLSACSKDWVSCALPGIDADGWLNNSKSLLTHGNTQDDIGVAGAFGQAELDPGSRLYSHRVHTVPDGTPDSRYPSASFPSGWIEMLDLVPPHNCILNRRRLTNLGGFAVTPWLQRGFWWEMCVRLSRAGNFLVTSTDPPRSKWSWETYPLESIKPSFSLDTIARLAVRYCTVSDLQGQGLAAADLPELKREDQTAIPIENSQNEQVNRAVESIRTRWPQRPLRITILSGPFEPHHNQIFFYNFFRLVEGQGLLSWRTIDDEYATVADVQDADLLILCRVRSKNGCDMLDWARRMNKRVLYMLDDNWFKMGSEWAEYKTILAPDSDFLKNALYCIRSATAVLTFSPVMHSYLEPHAKRVFEIPMAIDLTLFEAATASRDSSQLLIGYAGSPRRDQGIFEALVKIARRHANALIYYIGWEPPGILQQIPADQLWLQPGTFSFTDYARTLAMLAPDIGLAPLGITESERAKNPTKYLDYAAVHCAGIYSAVEPYTTHVKHGQTGWLAAGADPESWVDAIETLIADKELRTRIQAQAYADVKERFSTAVILPSFLSMFAELLAR